MSSRAQWWAPQPASMATTAGGTLAKNSSKRDRVSVFLSTTLPCLSTPKPVTIRLDEETIAYFKDMAEEKGIPYQSLINLYLRDCAERNRDLKVKWS